MLLLEETKYEMSIRSLNIPEATTKNTYNRISNTRKQQLLYRNMNMIGRFGSL